MGDPFVPWLRRSARRWKQQTRLTQPGPANRCYRRNGSSRIGTVPLVDGWAVASSRSGGHGGPVTHSERHLGLDWLRIGAFGLLIVYHVAMVFAPWHWVIKAPVAHAWLIVPMVLATPWRLPLLFCVSGFASRRLLDGTGSLRGFLRSRNFRLLLPWAFAMAALLPPELWVRARLNGYDHGLVHYWLVDYWSITPVAGFAFPTWEHLWFIAYLWAYTMAIAGALALAGGDGAQRLTRSADTLAHRHRLLWIPIAALVTTKLALLFVVPEEHGLSRDWAGHAEFLPIFVFGFALGGRTRLWPAIARSWRPALAIAVASAAALVAVELRYRGEEVPPHAIMALDRAARLAFAWTAILLLLGAANRFGNRDARWRATLCEAVFPFYLIHHPVIVVLAWLLLPLGLPAGITFALLLAGTAANCAAFYLIGRQIGWLRPLIGLGRSVRVPTADDLAGVGARPNPGSA